LDLPEKDLKLPEKDLKLPEKDLELPEKDLDLPEKDLEPMRPKAECDCGGAKSYKSAENTIVKSGFLKVGPPHGNSAFGLMPTITRTHEAEGRV
jgi:hypothetical protein